MFVAVNSGNSPADVAKYFRKIPVRWPVIVDYDRSFERSCGVQPISGRNTMQLRLVTAEGRMINGNWAKLEESVTTALKGAHWNVDPEGIPASLQKTWQAVEFGDYPSAAASLKRSARSRKSEVKTAAERLHAYVKESLDEQVAAAQQLLDADQRWEAYQTYHSIRRDFKGYEIPTVVAGELKKLSADKRIKTELLARKRLDAILKSMGSETESARKRARKMLSDIGEKYPDTEAGQRAREMLGAEDGISNGRIEFPQ